MRLNSETSFHFVELDERQLRQLSDAQATWSNYVAARQEAAQVRGSMRWRTVKGGTYLVRVSPSGGETSLGPRDERTSALFENFHRRKAAAEARMSAMKKTLDEQRRLNRALRIGRTPAVVVRALAALDEAALADQFLTIGTHAMHAYETAAGVRVEQGAMATMDLDLLFDMNKLSTYSRRVRSAQSLIQVFRRADPTFRVKRDRLHTAVNDSGFEIDVVRRVARDQDPHPLRMSDDEDDFWAIQIDQGERIAGGRKFGQVVVAATGEMAWMPTLHPLDFIRLKRELGSRKTRDPLKAAKDRLQAGVVQQLWDRYLKFQETPADGAASAT
jgi:hypothetical protein